MMKIGSLMAASALLVLLGSEAYQPSQTPRPNINKIASKQQFNHHNPLAVAAATAALSVLLTVSPGPALASDSAAQISLERLPPSSISVQIKDLPVVGNLLSGTYAKVPDGRIKNPSLVIKSPKDKVKAISGLATGGHLEFDLNGLLNSHLDVDVAADTPGVMKVRVASNLIPKLPFKNLASPSSQSLTGGKESAWNMVTNMGNGDTYYYNEKSGLVQYDKPDKL